MKRFNELTEDETIEDAINRLGYGCVVSKI